MPARLLLFPLVLAILLAASPANAQSPGGAVTGRVINAATTAYLADASVEVPGTGHSTVTDRDGYFRLGGLPAGEVTLVVSYAGLEPQRVSVTVPASGTAVRDIELTSQVYVLEKYTVAGLREGNALAIMQQQQAPNVKHVVSSDTFGNVADGNIGDFLQRLPGLTAVYVGADVRQVMIRGIDPDLNSVTMDGNRVASSNSANLGRAFEFEQSSLGLIETIEVTKAPTPDMDADSIGGSVNLVTKSAFDRANNRYFAFTIAGVHRPDYNVGTDIDWRKQPIENIGPSLNATYSNVFGSQRNIGVLLSATYHSQPGGSTAALLGYQPTLDERAFVHTANLPRPGGAQRTRLATGAKLDYKLSERTIISLNTSYNRFHENNDTRTFQLSTGQVIAAFNAAGVRTNNGTIHPNYTSTFTEVLPANNSLATNSVETNDKNGATFQVQPSVRHRFDRTEIDYNLTWSDSYTYYDHSPYDRKYKSKPRGTVAMTLRNIGWTVDRSRDVEWPTVTQTAGPDIYDLNNYSAMVLTQPDRRGTDSIAGARFNLKRQIDLEVPAYIKTGFSVREQTRETWRSGHRYNYAGADGVAGNADDQLGQFLDLSGAHSDALRGYRRPPWPNAYLVAQHQIAHPELWLEDIAYRETQARQFDRELSERVTAAYLLGNVRLNRLSILGGLRVEETKTDGEGPLQRITPEERARRAAFTGPLTAEEIIRRAEAEWSTRDHSSGKYRNVFPGIHFRYEPVRGLVSRLSYSTGIGRPDFGSIIPLANANYENRTVTATNTSLRPQYSDNFDLSLEYYFEPLGLISTSFFLKELKDFIFTRGGQIVGDGPDNGFDGEFEGFTLTSQDNGGSARVRGVEFSYQQQFTFLPGFWSGFGVNANYTYLETKGDYGGAVQVTEIPGFFPRAGNLGITYTKYGWDIRVLGTWRGRYLQTVNANPALIAWRIPSHAVNVKLKYKLNRNLAVFCDLEQIVTNDFFGTYVVNENRPTQTRLASPKIVAGIQGRY